MFTRLVNLRITLKLTPIELIASTRLSFFFLLFGHSILERVKRCFPRHTMQYFKSVKCIHSTLILRLTEWGFKHPYNTGVSHFFLQYIIWMKSLCTHRFNCCCILIRSRIRFQWQSAGGFLRRVSHGIYVGGWCVWIKRSRFFTSPYTQYCRIHCWIEELTAVLVLRSKLIWFLWIWLLY